MSKTTIVSLPTSADARTQALSLRTNGFGDGLLTAYQLRAVAEPQAYSLMAGVNTLLALALKSRRNS